LLLLLLLLLLLQLLPCCSFPLVSSFVFVYFSNVSLLSSLLLSSPLFSQRARSRQIDSFCSQQLAPYSSLFPPGNDASTLDQVDRRFAWFRRLLRSVDERFSSVFPPHWHLQYKICLTFLQQTRDSLLALLEDDTSSDSENVIVIVKALQKSLHFEKEMTARFERDYGSSVANTTVGETEKLEYDERMEYGEDGEVVDPKSAQGIKLRYARERARKASLADKTGTAMISVSAQSAKGESERERERGREREEDKKECRSVQSPSGERTR